jgi:membrane fusion protein, macrolide-specific efflux system
MYQFEGLLLPDTWIRRVDTRRQVSCVVAAGKRLTLQASGFSRPLQREPPLMNDRTTDSPSRDPRRRRPGRVLIAVVAGVLVAGSAYAVHQYRNRGGAGGEYLFAAVESGDIEDLVTSTGTLQPRDYVDVGAQVSGQIEKLYVEIGDVVKAGDVLASIDADTSEARVEANQASLKSARSSLATQKNNLEKARRDWERQENLKKEDATTEEARQNAATAWETARNQVAQSEAQIEQQIANMRIEENNLKYTRIVAPIGGTVMSIAVKEGQTVNATQVVPNVMRIANLGTMTVQSDVSEADVSKLYNGVQVYFTTLGGGNRRWYSTLKRIEPTPKVQNSVVLYNALFDIDNEGGTLMPSMTAQVFFVNAEARNVLTVPMAALQQGQQITRELAAKEEEKEGPKPASAAAATGVGAPAAKAMKTAATDRPALGSMNGGSAPRQARRRNGTVMVRATDGKLESRRVAIGVTNRVMGEVLEGLKEGEEVVIGKREKEAAAAATTTSQNQQQGQQNRNNPLGGGGFPGGGRPF